MDAERLLGFGVATLHEAAGRRGAVDGIRLFVGEPFAGPASTVGIPAGDNLGVPRRDRSGDPRVSGLRRERRPGPPRRTGRTPTRGCTSTRRRRPRHRRRNRDVDEPYPPPSVAALALTPRGTIKERLREPVGSPVALGRVLVRSDDWVVCDRNGVCVLPADAVETIALLEGLLADLWLKPWAAE